MAATMVKLGVVHVQGSPLWGFGFHFFNGNNNGTATVSIAT